MMGFISITMLETMSTEVSQLKNVSICVRSLTYVGTSIMVIVMKPAT